MLVALAWIVCAIYLVVKDGGSVSTKISRKHRKNLPFPSFTICNNNLYKKSYILGHEMQTRRFLQLVSTSRRHYLEHVLFSQVINKDKDVEEKEDLEDVPMSTKTGPDGNTSLSVDFNVTEV